MWQKTMVRVTVGLLLVNMLEASVMHNESYSKLAENDDTYYLINTPGCLIPNYGKTINYTNEYGLISCGQRIIDVRKVSDNQIRFDINNDVNYDKKLTCCYSFVSRMRIKTLEDNYISYSPCKYFKPGDVVELEQEVIAVKCVPESTIARNTITAPSKVGQFITGLLQKAVEAFMKMLMAVGIELDRIGLVPKDDEFWNPDDTIDIYYIVKKKPENEFNLLYKDINTRKRHWNVLLLGMDSMSRVRAHKRMPKVVQYFSEKGWLDYRGYHKTGDNTFPNTMALLTGIHPNEHERKFESGVEEVRDMFIWNRFKESGYVTAFGEDTVYPTYSRQRSFRAPPTDHYFRPVMLTGQYIIKTLTCVGKRPSFLRLINFASQIAAAYKNDKFFGYFWTSTFSHNPEHTPSLSQKVLINFFKGIEKIGILGNTFVFFIGDHGINYGDNRYSKELYYDSKLPMLFIWVPDKFRILYSDEYRNLKLNQYRLTTNFDLHATFWNILKMSNSNIRIVSPKACPSCQGLTEEISPTRTCAEANIEEKWCSCHDFTELTTEEDEIEFNRSLSEAWTFVQNKASENRPLKCKKCIPFTFKKLLWRFMFAREDRKYYVFAFMLDPNDAVFEAKVEVYNHKYTIVNVECVSPCQYANVCVTRNFCYCACSNIPNCS